MCLQTKSKVQADGTFIPQYAEYLIEKLEVLTELKKELNATAPVSRRRKLSLLVIPAIFSSEQIAAT